MHSLSFKLVIVFLLFILVKSSDAGAEHSSAKEFNVNAGGVSLVSFEEGSLYEKLGLRKGDIIKTINGKPVKNPKDTETLYNLLKSSDKLEIEIIRDGLTKKLNYNIK